jgi:HTH-type transcriptional regulator/antitoxin HipB
MPSNGNQASPLGSVTAQLGAVVRARRKALKLRQAELAALAGVGLAFLYELEHGKPTVRIDKVLAVLSVLGLELHVREGKQPLTIATALCEENP